MHCDEIQVKLGKEKIGAISTTNIYQVSRPIDFFSILSRIEIILYN